MRTTAHFRGDNRTGIRAYNERVILNFIRRFGPVPKAEIARETGLSAQSASVIVNTLLRDELLKKEAKVRGQIGQPTTPIALRPDGAFSVGVKIGRRSMEVAIVDFVGTVRQYSQILYTAPTRRKVEILLTSQLRDIMGALTKRELERLAGIGVALPGQIGAWHEELGLTFTALEDWSTFDIEAEICQMTELPIEIHNDATAACAAEMLLGASLTVPSALYVYLGTFIGGGVVLGGRLYEGQHGNAGAIGSMPMTMGGNADSTDQLIRHASVIFLEQALRDLGLDPIEQIEGGFPDPRAANAFATWSRQSAESIAHLIACATSVIDFQDVVIDSVLPRAALDAVHAKVIECNAAHRHKGLVPTTIRTGGIGSRARVIGAALMPLIREFSPHQELLVKQASNRR